jgi:hypothetical protein
MITLIIYDGGELLLWNGIRRNWIPHYLGTVVIAIVAALAFKSNSSAGFPFKERGPSFDVKSKHLFFKSVPFVVMAEPNWKVLRMSLDTYRAETRKSLEQLSIALEVVVPEEERAACCSNRLKFSDHLREKMQRLSDLYDHDLDVLQRLVLIPFPTTLALPNSTQSSVPALNQHRNHEGDNEEEHGFTRWSNSHNRCKLLEEQRPYDSAIQVVAHLVRDWSVGEGAPIRASIYSWCVEQLGQHYVPSQRGPVLVPGAGLGRLAWELATNLDCSVEAVESSISMAAAAHAIMHLNDDQQQSSYVTGNRFELHPYAVDAFSNEVNSLARYDAVQFPDVVPTLRRGSLSYTIGDFGYDTMLHLRNHYDAVVTCFFVDTATTVYDYLETIAMVLAPGGTWINVGPLQWHINSKVPVAIDELRMILESFCDHKSGKPVFEILHWRVDQLPVSYRNDDRHRSTRFDAYCPLRFVLRKRKRD